VSVLPKCSAYCLGSAALSTPGAGATERRTWRHFSNRIRRESVLEFYDLLQGCPTFGRRVKWDPSQYSSNLMSWALVEKPPVVQILRNFPTSYGYRVRNRPPPVPILSQINAVHTTLSACGSVVVKALCYKPEGRGIDTRWGDFLNVPNPSYRTWPWGLLSL
jgi:hypothetical protein